MWKSWKYKNLTILTCSFILSLFLGSYPPFKDFVRSQGVFAAFIPGVFFISTFTAPVSAVTLLVLAAKYPLPLIWIIASIGAIMSDFLFFKYTKDNIGKEIEPVYKNLTGGHFHRVLNTRHFRWLLPVVGTLIIFSPLPKEPGIHLLGIPKLKSRDFILISALVNIAGIAFILFLSLFIKL